MSVNWKYMILWELKNVNLNKQVWLKILSKILTIIWNKNQLIHINQLKCLGKAYSIWKNIPDCGKENTTDRMIRIFSQNSKDMW